MNKKLIRKMQTAAGGPLRIKFTPEQIAYFESQATRVPGMNNSGGNRYREKGVLALLYLEQETKRKEEEIKSRMEMRPTLKRKATTAEKLQGKKDEYEQKPQIVGMSGTDPIGEFILAGIGLNGIGALAKTGLWETSRFLPKTWVGNHGRLYFVGNAFKNSFNGTVPTLTSQATSLLYLPTKQNETGLTSLKFFERKPSRISEAERAGVPKAERSDWLLGNNSILGSYTYEDPSGVGNIDFLKEFFNRQKIQGLEYTYNGGLKLSSKNVLIGLPENIKTYLNENTVERNVRAMRKAGYSEREIQMYKDKVNEEMLNVRVGLYSGEDYKAANSEDFGGFFDDSGNFISVNKDAHLKDSKFTPDYVMKHEGRHLIDHRTSMTDELYSKLEKAYDKDFLDIPNHEDAGVLKGYLHMADERVTTNRDARDVLLSSKGKYLLNEHDFLIDSSKRGYSADMVDFLNKIIKYAQPEDIVNAVENSNGYGKRYIKYLREHNKLTPEKIEQFREAMMDVGMGVGVIYGLNINKKKQGGKMNILEFLKNGSGIYIKPKNRGKFTKYCHGKVTDECIRKAKASGNPTLVKRATFAANARKWKHKKGGKAFVPGASITDSRPEAYWEIKKKKKLEWLEKKLLGGYFNPNAMGGIFGETMLRKLYEQELLRLKELMKQLKAQLEALQIQQEADRTSGLINTIGNIGLSFLANKALSKNGVPNSLTQQQPNMLKDVGFKSNVLNNNIINNTSVDEMRNLILQ